MQGAIIGTKDGQLASQQLNARIQPKQKDLELRQHEIAQLQDQLDRQGVVLSPEKRAQLLQQIEGRKRKLQRDASDAQKDLAAEQQRLLQTLGQKLKALIQRFPKDNHFSLVLDEGSPDTPVLFVSVNITQDMIAQYDKMSAGGPASVPPAGSSEAPSSSSK